MSRLSVLSGGIDDKREWTATENLYFRFKFCKTKREREEAFEGLVRICAKAVGHLTPPWRGTWNSDFHHLRHKSRLPWCRGWLYQHLKKPQLDLCRYVGRRCYCALVSEIRKVYSGSIPVQKTTAPLRDSDDIPTLDNGHSLPPQELLADALEELNKHRTHSSPKSAFTKEELDYVKFSILFRKITGKPPINVKYAERIGRSEGYVRKLAKEVRAKIHRGKQERIAHYYEGKPWTTEELSDRFIRRHEAFRHGERGGRNQMIVKVK